MKTSSFVRNISVLAAMAVFTASAAEKIPHKTWTDPASVLREDKDFAIQGEYRSGGSESATAAPFSKPMAGPEGPVFLQNHGNPVVFRNIWIVPGS